MFRNSSTADSSSPSTVSPAATHFTLMAYIFSSPCVYNIPMALDDTLSHTEGLDRQFSRHRCQSHLDDSVNFIVGPMPPSDFLNVFLPSHESHDKSQRMKSENAFQSVPACADSSSAICEPLVSSCPLWRYNQL